MPISRVSEPYPQIPWRIPPSETDFNNWTEYTTADLAAKEMILRSAVNLKETFAPDRTQVNSLSLKNYEAILENL